MTFVLESDAFRSGAAIPEIYAQTGENISPPLSWSGLPERTKSLVLIVEDPDAPVGTVTHWVVYDIDPETRGLAADASDRLSQGDNDMGHARYDGPKPPPGHGPHHYHFRLAALDVASLDLSSLLGAPSHTDVKNVARKHIIAETEIVGTFETK